MADYVSRYTGAEIDAAIDKIRSGAISTNPNAMGFGVATTPIGAERPSKFCKWIAGDTADVKPGSIFAVKFEMGNSYVSSNVEIVIAGLSASSNGNVISAKTGQRGLHIMQPNEYALFICKSDFEIIDLGPFPSTGDGGGTDISLGVTNSAVGNVLLVGSVDTSGKPTSYTTKAVKVWDGSGSY